LNGVAFGVYIDVELCSRWAKVVHEVRF
jgi:hypothetical protein